MRELLRRFLPPWRRKALVGILTKMVEVAFEVLTPVVVAAMIDAAQAGAGTGKVLGLGGLLLLFAAVSYAFTFCCQRLAAQVSQGMGTDVRDALYAQVNRLSTSQVAHFGAPSLVTRVTSDVNQVQLAVALTIRTLTRWPLLAIGSAVAAFVIDWQLGLVFVVCMPAVWGVFAYVMSRSVPFFKAMQERLDHISLVVRETLEGMRVIRAFREERLEDGRASVAVASHAEVAIAQGSLAAVLNPATFLIMNLGICAILLVGGGRVNTGELTAGTLVAFVAYMNQALVAVSACTNLVVVIMRAQTSAGRIMEVLTTEPEIEGGDEEAKLSETAPALMLDHVSYRYPGSAAPALEDVTLTVPRGSTLGVIGGTGSGKSTLVSVLTRLVDIDEGSVEVSGVEIRDLALTELHRLVALVPQHVSLVSGTIRENLTWREAEASDEALWHALEVAQAAEFVRALPEGLDAPVEAGGRNFSGGQRQRLTIARALVGDPAVIVLDDAASALDFATDSRLRKALSSLEGSPTCVVVSQRVSSVMGSDQILVLDHGRMAGLGTHADLMRTCAIYAEICASQLKGEDHG